MINEAQAEAVKMEDFFSSTIEQLDLFDKACWRKGDGLKIPAFPEVEKRLEGLEEGLYLFAAESNMGKSAMMMNMVYSIATCKENNTFGLYFSLDDSANEILPRIISMNQMIPISASSKPQRYLNMIEAGEENSAVYETYLEKRTEGIQQLKENASSFKVVDGNSVRTLSEVKEYIKKVKRFLRAEHPDKKLIVAIDSINDLKLDKDKADTNAMSEIAREVKEWTVEFGIPIFGSTHLRKLNSNRRPTLDDLKDSSVIAFEASVVWLVFNDVSKNGESASIYYNTSGEADKKQVIEMDWRKNKKSSYKGRTYAYFAPNYSKATEVDKESMKRFDSLIYEG